MVIDVTEHGVVGDGRVDDTLALQRILNTSPHKTILIPTDTVVITGPLSIAHDHVTLQINGRLQAWDVTTFILDSVWPQLPPLITYGNSRDVGYLQYQSLLYAANVTNLHITGNGVIDGRGQAWWDLFSSPNRRTLLKAGRPNLIQIVNSTNVEIDSVELRDSPFWTLHPVLCQYVYIHHVTIRSPMYAPNVDGIDPDSCRHVTIEHNDISCGDDHIAIKAGVCGLSSPNDCTDPVWSSGNFQTDNVTVRHNTFRTGMGVAIGSEVSGSVTNVNIYNNTIGFCIAGHNDTKACGWGPGLHVKSTISRGGRIENIAFHDNVVYNSSMFILLEMDYQIENEKPPSDYAPTSIRNVSFVNNTSLGSAKGATFGCSVYDACHGISVINNTITTEANPWACRYIANYTVGNNRPSGLGDCMADSMTNHSLSELLQSF